MGPVSGQGVATGTAIRDGDFRRVHWAGVGHDEWVEVGGRCDTDGLLLSSLFRNTVRLCPVSVKPKHGERFWEAMMDALVNRVSWML